MWVLWHHSVWHSFTCMNMNLKIELEHKIWISLKRWCRVTNSGRCFIYHWLQSTCLLNPSQLTLVSFISRLSTTLKKMLTTPGLKSKKFLKANYSFTSYFWKWQKIWGKKLEQWTLGLIFLSQSRKNNSLSVTTLSCHQGSIICWVGKKKFINLNEFFGQPNISTANTVSRLQK